MDNSNSNTNQSQPENKSSSSSSSSDDEIKESRSLNLAHEAAQAAVAGVSTAAAAITTATATALGLTEQHSSHHQHHSSVLHSESSNNLSVSGAIISATDMNTLRTRYENGEEVVTVNGHTGVLVNKREIENFRGPVPLSEYPINEDPNPIVVPKKCQTPHHATQEITVRYLEPPPLPPPGEIIIQQEAPVIPPPAPPIVIRKPAPHVEQKEALIIREAPPKMPLPIGRKIIKILAPKVPPPPRKVIVEQPPAVADKAQAIIIERWLAPKIQPRRVIFEGTTQHHVQHPPVRNEIHVCEAPNVIVNKQFKDLGVARMDPQEYWERHRGQLVDPNNLPDFVREIRPPPGMLLASDIRPDYYIPRLEGELHLLDRIDLHREGLSEYSSYTRTSGGGSSSSGGIGTVGGLIGGATGATGGTYYESRATSSPPRGGVIRTIVDSAFRSDNGGGYPAGATASSSSTAVYKSTTTYSDDQPGGGYQSRML